VKTKTSIVTALALLALAAPAANAKHQGIPWEPRVAPAQKPLLRCTVKQEGYLVTVPRGRCGQGAVNSQVHNA
jgi:hypothetical protein